MELFDLDNLVQKLTIIQEYNLWTIEETAEKIGITFLTFKKITNGNASSLSLSTKRKLRDFIKNYEQENGIIK